MRYERTRQRDAITAPIHPWFDREDGNFEGFGGQSWDQDDGWSNRTNAGLEPVKEAIRHPQPVWAAYAGKIGGLWSKILRQRETGRIKAAWELIDDRTLKDIGISRYEIERASDARHWS
jgi:uncharacterized protein YjiS (DUF1127 family)